ncbi:lysine-specific demethylase lid [Dorcoceras hygrometricum]|uniref:Lysine-specific demethylase lid n=1 Tax=Dorcoceras hygrometricum TaxID=472368 RepID=A0A2Z7B130_9LAMI|nr:lysine-specific demethylase lid [Dorcoceras hygrometricum]
MHFREGSTRRFDGYRPSANTRSPSLAPDLLTSCFLLRVGVAIADVSIAVEVSVELAIRCDDLLVELLLPASDWPMRGRAVIPHSHLPVGIVSPYAPSGELPQFIRWATAG